MKILITGNEGFIGRHMSAALKDHEVTGFDIKSGVNARDWFQENNEYFDVVIHAAAVVGGRVKIDGFPLALMVNLAIDVEMFQWAARTKPGKVIFFSSSAAYPVDLQTRELQISLGDVRPLKEEDIKDESPGLPDAIYGWIKLTGEKLAAYAANEGLNVFVARPFSGYGTDQDLDYPFPSFIDRGLKKPAEFEIWGDGSQIRDWIHVDDICRALVVAINDDITGTYNLATGIGTRFDDLAQKICGVIGYQPEFTFRPDKPTGVHTRVGDPTKMKEFYEPRISIIDGIALAVREKRAQ